MKLTASGNKAELQARLKEYSGNPNSWNLSQPGAHRAHKGSHSGTKKTGLKGYKKRRAELIPEADPGKVQRSKDTRSRVQKEEMVAWAKKFIRDHPQRPRSPKRLQEESNAFVSNRQISSQLTNIQQELKRLAVNPRLPTPILSMSTVSPVANVHLPVPIPSNRLPIHTPSPVLAVPVPSPASTTTPYATPPSSSPPPSSPPPSTPVISDSKDMSSALPTSTSSVVHLTLYDGTTLSFRRSDVPPPPNLSFSDNIDLLARMWTDSHARFREEECPLKIQGRGIALKYWIDVYKRKERKGPDGKPIQDTRWKGTRGKWNKWKYIAERYNSSTPEDFWAEYSRSDGTRMNWSDIDKTMRKQRAPREDDA
ncbi:hypothetical protein V5O48_018008 [Marasmius crinis-equi]|uniref:SAP domain-containing protein n=1 Tax=Marasmius crinis-equi TaxID=585013 RepID=A0ABR3EME2_9AGAR